jgi:hypothetical protein
VAASGWATWSGLVALLDDDRLDLDALRQLMARVEATLATQAQQVQSAMSGFLIAAGVHVTPLTALALAISTGQARLASVSGAIQKMQNRGAIGKKRKTVKC